METLFDTFRALFSTAVFLTLIFGAGSFLWQFLKPKTSLGHWHTFVLVIALGMTSLAFFGWLLGMLGIYTRVITIILCTGCFVFLIYKHSLSFINLFKHYDAFGFKAISKILLNNWPDFILVLIFLPALLNGLLSPFLAGDAIYSFNTWAQHWAIRSNMSDYYFALYGQFMSILASWLYKIMGSAASALPNEQYLLHGFYVAMALLGFITFRRLVLLIEKGHYYSIAWFITALILLSQYDIHESILSGTAETFIIFFIPLLTFELIACFQARAATTADLLRFAIILAGFVFIKPSIVPLAAMFGLFRIGCILRPFSMANLARTLKAGCILFGIVAILAGPFYTQQKSWWGKASMSFVTNHSFYPGYVPELKEISSKANNGYKSVSGARTDIGVFLYRATEVFLPAKYRNKPANSCLYMFRLPGALVIIIALFGLTQLWVIPFFIIFIIQGYLWWIYAAYGYYDLIPALMVFGGVLGSGFISIIKLSWWKLRSVLFRYCINAMLIGIILFFASLIILPWTKEFIFIAKNRGIFLAQDYYQRLSAYFPNDAEAVKEALTLHKNELEPWKWKKLVVAAELPIKCFLPNSVALEHVQNLNIQKLSYLAPNGIVYEKFHNKYLNAEYTIIRHNIFPCSFQAGGTWIRPADRYFYPIDITNNIPVINYTELLANADKLIIKIYEDTRDDSNKYPSNIDVIFNSHIISDSTWESFVNIPANQLPRLFSEDALPHEFAFTRSSYGSSVYGGMNMLVLEGLPQSMGKWITRSEKQKGPTPAYFRKHVKLNKTRLGTIQISAADKYELFINGKLIGSGNNWVHLDKYNYSFNDGDVIVAKVYNTENSEILFIDIAWQNEMQNELKYQGTESFAKTNVYYFERGLSPSEINQAKLTGILYIPDLTNVLCKGRTLLYYPVKANNNTEH